MHDAIRVAVTIFNTQTAFNKLYLLAQTAQLKYHLVLFTRTRSSSLGFH